MKTDLVATVTVFPQPEDIPQLTAAFMRMMMAHAAFEWEVRTLQSSVTKDPNFGEQRKNQWPAGKRPRLMAKLIDEKLGQIPESKAIRKLLKDACVPCYKRNDLVHGTWWRFEQQTETITVRLGSQQKNKDTFAESAELYKLRRDIESRRGDHDGDELDVTAEFPRQVGRKLNDLGVGQCTVQETPIALKRQQEVVRHSSRVVEGDICAWVAAMIEWSARY
jgi:hypothetical protein